MKINRTKNDVRYLLSAFPDLRDDDSRLLANFWSRELQAQGISSKDIRGFELLALIAMKQLSTPESVFRMRRKLQEENIDLRGKAYEKRHKEVKQVQNDLGYGIV